MSNSDLKILLPPGTPAILTTRTFKAPRALVFEAFTSAKHLPHWWGPREQKMVGCEVDLRPGGGYRFQLRGPDGGSIAFSGKYYDVTTPERLVQTFIFEPMPQHDAVETLIFTDNGDTTIVTSILVHKSVEARDGHAGAGMERGLTETYDRLDEFLAE